MSKKSTIPPPRPPAPRGGGSSGMSFSFKALEEGDDEDEELTILGGKFDKQVSQEREKQARQSDKERSYSKSPVEKIQTFGEEKPLTRSQNSLEKIKDFTGKIQDTISRKIDEFSDSPTKSEPINIKEQTKQFTGDFESSLEKSEAKDDVFTADEINGFSSVNNETQYFDMSGESEKSEGLKPDSTDDLNMVDEYYNPERAEDFSDLPGVVPMVRQRKKFHFIKSKPAVPPAPISMSKISKDLKEDLTETVKPEPEMDKNINNDNLASNIAILAKDKVNTVVNFAGKNVPVCKIIGGVIVMFLYMILPLPSYINGLIAGLILSSAGWSLYLWIMQPRKPREVIPDLPMDQLPPMPVPEMKEPKGEDGSYKGWMNEVMNYSPDNYSINQTHSIYVHLEGTTLRLRRPKINILKRAMWDEPNTTPQFVHQRHFDITGSCVLLLPPGLVKKRLWSKKYPICVCLARDGKKVNLKQPTSPGHGFMMAHSNSFPNMSSSILPEDTGSTRGFEIVSEQKCDTSIIYLFARTCREKEQWYRRFEAAAKGMPLCNHILEVQRILNKSNARHRRSSSSESLKHKRQESTDSTSSASSPSADSESVPGEVDLREFVTYMSRLIPKGTVSDSLPSSPAHTATSKDSKSSEPKNTIPRGITCDPILTPLNALLGRCFWDFLRDRYWADVVKEKLQKKLSKIHIPYFIEELQISNIDLGAEIPVIRRANKPFLDENGFWVDLDVTYSGKFKMTIETKVNLLKLKKPVSAQPSVEKEETDKSAVTDSNEEDSAESSTDEEEEAPSQGDEGHSSGKGKTWMKYINKITASKYFQSAAENKYIKKAMTEVSNTRLILTVELQKLNGTLAVNIPPPPTDRLWYGFRGNPQLWLVAKPKVGEREVTMSHITEWIEKKLSLEFQHVFVMPNMDDLVIPILIPGNTGMSENPLASSDSGSPV